MNLDYRASVREFRAKLIEGGIVSLLPYDNAYARDIVALRNQPNARYFLNQDGELTIESQSAWYQSYCQRDNDIYWLVRSRRGEIVGTNRLYDIDSKQAEKGSLVIDAMVARGAPYALEAELLCLRFAFETLGLTMIVTRTREDNDKMESMNRRFGFEQSGVEDVRGARYKVFTLDGSRFDPRYFQDIVDHWRRKLER